MSWRSVKKSLSNSSQMVVKKKLTNPRTQIQIKTCKYIQNFSLNFWLIIDDHDVGEILDWRHVPQI